jgi:hypothetical protein
MNLPELPIPMIRVDEYVVGFAVEQMLALRAAAYRAGMERAAEIAAELAKDDMPGGIHGRTLRTVAAIRSEIAKNEQQGTERETR